VNISIIESGSWGDTKGALGELGVEKSIEMRNSTHEDEDSRVPEPEEQGWIWTSRGRKELGRIPYLAGLRNQAMGKLRELGRGDLIRCFG